MRNFVSFAILLLLFSCKTDRDFNKISEGTIEYDITYFSDSASSVPEQFLPKTMLLQFNQNYASYKIEDIMGIFCITNITNLTKRNHVSTIKLFNNKYKYIGKKQELPVFFQPKSLFVVQETDDTVTLAGLLCQKSIVTDVNGRRKFDIAYSDKFIIKHPNINTPYSDINGMLMKFEIDLGNMRLTLKAKKVTRGPVKNKTFRIDEEYKNISESKMREIIATMIR